MKRSGNIGASKNLDSVFADFTDDELEQDLIFDEDDQLVEIVEGYTEDGNTIFEEDEEIFNLAHQVAEEDDAKPEEVIKNAEKILGPDNDTDENIKGIENVEKTDLDDSQTIENLEKNGESEADKELGLDKLEDEYHSSATVEEAFNKWLKEEFEIPGDENTAEGTDDKFGKEVDNSLPTDDSKVNGDEEYNDTNDATVNESEMSTCDCGKEGCPICSAKIKNVAPEEERHEESNGETITAGDGEGIAAPGEVDDNTLPTPDNVTPEGSPESDNGSITDDGSIEEAFNKWLKEEFEIPGDENTAEGTDDKFGKEVDNSLPTDDSKVNGDEEYNDTNDATVNEAYITEANANKSLAKKIAEIIRDFVFDQGITNFNLKVGGFLTSDFGASSSKFFNGKSNEFFLTIKYGTSADNAISTINGVSNTASADKVKEVVQCINQNKDAIISDIKKQTGKDIEIKNKAIKSGSAISITIKNPDTSVDEAFEKWLNEADNDLEIPLDNGETPMLPEDDNAEHEELEKSAPETSTDECGTANVPTSNATVAAEMEAFTKWLNEETDETEVPTAEDVEDAAETEAEDTESEFDDDIAAIADDESDEADVDLEYDPTDEELIDIAGGND